MNDYARIALLGRLYRLYKEAGYVDKVLAIPGGAAKIIGAASGAAGKETAKQLGGGLLGKGVGSVVKAAPVIAGVAALQQAGAGRYMKGKLDEFKARQYETQPYYDPETQRFS